MANTDFSKLLPVTFTEKALVEVKKIITTKNIPTEYALRVGIRGGGCSGLSFLLGFDKPKEGDDRYELDGLKVLVEKKHTMYLLGIEVDYEEGANASGFIFNNPSATGS
jgi:iron-sulfur cluster assembly protein